MTNRFSILSAVSVFLVVTLPTASVADTSTLTLDELSFISFQNQEILELPSGSTVVFNFAPPAADGSVAFTIAPQDVSIAPISLPGSGGQLEYGLASTASGVMRSAEGGRIIEFAGNVTASLDRAGDQGTFVYTIPFTTETVSATDLLGSLHIEVTGLRLVEGAWYAQIVGATTNKANAFPEPGAAVYTVLSGQFDHLPALGP